MHSPQLFRRHLIESWHRLESTPVELIGKYSPLLNEHELDTPITIVEEGRIYKFSSVYNYVMFYKYRLSDDPRAQKICKLANNIYTTSSTLKTIIEELDVHDPAHWNVFLYPYLLTGNLKKYDEDRELRSLLLSTGHRDIKARCFKHSVTIEERLFKKVANTDQVDFKTLNLFGNVLMNVRTHIRSFS